MRRTWVHRFWAFWGAVAVGSAIASLSQAGGPPALSACCFSDESCDLLSTGQCGGAGGISLSGVTTCNPNPCLTLCGTTYPECDGDCSGFPTCIQESGECVCGHGACCFPSTLQCGLLLDHDSCDSAGGIYMGDGTNCSTCEAQCGFSAPECNGECPDDTRCGIMEIAQASGGVAAGGGAGTSTAMCACQPVTGACCQAETGSCSEIGEIACIGSGGTYQGDDTSCTEADCRRDCGFAEAPECDGQCPEGRTCSPALLFAQAQGAPGPQACQCSTPPGGACSPEQDDCRQGFVCDPASETCCNRICNGEGESCDDTGICRGVVLAPAASPAGLLVFLALLITAGAFGLLRNRARQS